MLILDEARIVVLEMPKTATQALRQSLAPYAREISDKQRHGGYHAFKRALYPRLTKEWGGIVECCCVVREPLARMQSWYRYRQRPKIEGTAKSTEGITFDQFIEALLSDSPPPFVQTGRQARFTGWDGLEAKVDHIFDYQRLDLFLEFLALRLGAKLKLQKRNQSTGPVPGPLPPALQASFEAEYADDYALYKAILNSGGHLQRGGRQPQRTEAAN